MAHNGNYLVHANDENMPDWLRKLFRKMDKPQNSLRLAYEELESATIKTRRQVSSSIAKEKKLEKRLAETSISAEKTANLETELILQKTETDGLRVRLESVETEAQDAYVKLQYSIAKLKAARAVSSSDPTRSIVVIVAIMTVWALIGVFLNLKSHY